VNVGRRPWPVATIDDRSQLEARHLLIPRNRLGEAFPRSVQSCTPGSTTAGIARCAASMGAYYPQAAECVAATFIGGGTEACFAEARCGR